MGLKSGSRDAGLDEESADAEDGVDASKTSDAETPPSEAAGSGAGDGSTTADEPASDVSTSGGSARPSMDSIPYKLRRSKVNEGREQVPYFLRPEVVDAEDDLRDALEDDLGESVYKSDYREAAMVVAQRRPELVADVLREWGYDLDGAGD